MPILIYLQLAVLIFLINVIPAFMPPTWVFLAFFYTRFHLDLMTTVIIGAVAATSGRIVLAHISKNFFRPILPQLLQRNYMALGEFFKKRRNLTIPIVLTYAFFPIPSNQIFIIAGLSDVHLKVVALSFLSGRLISYSFWISLTGATLSKINNWTDGNPAHAITAEIIGFSLLFLLGTINWAKILKIRK